MSIKNAVITNVMLGYEDHGILTLTVGLDYGGSCQHFGGYALDQWNESLKRRVGTAYGTEWIIRLLKTLEVESLQTLVGKSVRVEANHCHVAKIGHFLKDQWFDPSELLVDGQS